ncbi:MAG: hypothetical protein PHQ93_03025 [Sulfurimonas sp.]|nr:hypothetical protein [Sulfurimonas sp.]MDD5400144.1 hypothetical protein [Sulfurimonas sp.]
MSKHITYLRYLQQDINILVRTKQDDKKLCELRTKRDNLLLKVRNTNTK